MKKIFLLSTLFFTSCAVFRNVPPETIPNPECITGTFVIVQVLDDGFLLSACRYLPYSGVWLPTGPDAFFKVNTKKAPWNEFGEGMHLYTPLNNTCLKHDGTYKYTNALSQERIIMKVKGDDVNIPNPQYDEWKRANEQKTQEQKSESEKN